MRSNSVLLRVVAALFPLFLHGNTWRLEGVVLPERTVVPDDTIGAIFYDDFSRGYPGQWLGDTASFEVVNGLLGLVESTRPPVSIAIPSTQLQDMVWEMGVTASGGFSPSNYIRLYLAATTPLLQEPQWGYYLQIDGSEADHVYRLWRQNGVTRTAVFESGPMSSPATTFHARVRVTHTLDGYWQVAVDEYGNGTFEVLANKSNETSVEDKTYQFGGYSGYAVSFSPARWRDFKLDYLLIRRLDSSAGPDGTNSPGVGDVLINEVLSNPKPGGVDFLEIYNYSAKTIDLSGISIARVTTNGTVGSPKVISDHPLFIYPNEYKVLTRRPNVVQQHYPGAVLATFIKMESLPDFNNGTGGVVIYGQQGMIDSLFYVPTMQSPFMVSNQGVSLERQHFAVPTHAPGNFHSAAVITGGATPGYQNSHYAGEVARDYVFLTSKTFSPDSDGFEDRLAINYRLPKGAFMANVDIYTDQGRLVKRLVRNQSMATEGTVFWDGLSDANARLPIGMYIAVVEIYNADGIRKVYRKGFVLAGRL